MTRRNTSLCPDLSRLFFLGSAGHSAQGPANADPSTPTPIADTLSPYIPVFRTSSRCCRVAVHGRSGSHMFDERAEVDEQQARWSSQDRGRKPPTLLMLDPRRYRHHRGQLLCADRVFVGAVWTPVVRVRARLPRASEGATEI